MISRFSVDAHAAAVRDLAREHLRTLAPSRRGLFDRASHAVAAVEQAADQGAAELDVRLSDLIARTSAKHPALARAAEVLRSANSQHVQTIWEVQPDSDELESLGAVTESLARLRSEVGADRIVSEYDDGVIREAAPALYDQWAQEADPVRRVRVADRIAKVADLAAEADLFGRGEPDDQAIHAYIWLQTGRSPEGAERELDRSWSDLRRMDEPAEARSARARAAAAQLSRPLTEAELRGDATSRGVVDSRHLAAAAYRSAIEVWGQEQADPSTWLERDVPAVEQSSAFMRESDSFDTDDGPSQEVM